MPARPKNTWTWGVNNTIVLPHLFKQPVVNEQQIKNELTEKKPNEAVIRRMLRGGQIKIYKF